jgi:hypothetical protein
MAAMLRARCGMTTLYAPTDISGQHLATVHDAYRKWLGAGYDLGALDVVLCTAAAEQLAGDPPWLLVVGGSGAAKTETITPLKAAGAHLVSTLSGEAGLLSGTNTKERAKDATGGLLKKIGPRGLLVIKDFTSILSMNRDTRTLILAALREIHDGRWSRDIGGEGGKTLTWEGRLVVIGACTTVWDSAHQVISTMGDRFLLVRPRLEDRRSAGRMAMSNVRSETTMREELADAVGKLLDTLGPTGKIMLTDDEAETVLDVADLLSRARSPVERDYKGEPLFAHALEVPTRLSKQLAQLARGGIALGMDREAAMAVVQRCAADTMPPMRRDILLDVAAHPDTATSEVVKRLQVPRKTVDRVLQELQLLGLLTVNSIDYGEHTRWIYSLAPDVSRPALARLAGNVSRGTGDRP